MPAPFLVRSVKANNGITQIHMAVDLGQPSDVYLNVTNDVLKGIFGDDVRAGDVWTLSGVLLKRQGTNGINSG